MCRMAATYVAGFHDNTVPVYTQCIHSVKLDLLVGVDAKMHECVNVTGFQCVCVRANAYGCPNVCGHHHTNLYSCPHVCGLALNANHQLPYNAEWNATHKMLHKQTREVYQTRPPCHIACFILHILLPTLQHPSLHHPSHNSLTHTLPLTPTRWSRTMSPIFSILGSLSSSWQKRVHCTSPVSSTKRELLNTSS